MCDFDNREIASLENCFPGSSVYLCDFHTEQSWQRWLADGKHGVGSSEREEVLSLLRCTARSYSVLEYEENLDRLRNSPIFKSNDALSGYIEKSWIKNYQRWVFAFRKDLVNVRVSTTNGLERQHRDFKERFLRGHTLGKTLCGMVDVLINKFLPDRLQMYIRYNVESLGVYKQYSKLIPSFLHNRPKKFVLHCLDRMPPKQEISIADITRDKTYFYVASNSSSTVYQLELSEPMPSCTCKDWQNTHWPCKHMLGIFHHFPDNSWEFLHNSYTCSPYFSLDMEFLADMQTDYKVPDAEVEADIHVATNVTKGDKTLQECLDVVKNIQTGLYSVTCAEYLTECHEKLMAIDEFIVTHQDRREGLPIRHTLLRKRKARHFKKQRSKFAPKAKVTKSSETNTPEQEKVVIDGTFSMDDNITSPLEVVPESSKTHMDLEDNAKDTGKTTELDIDITVESSDALRLIDRIWKNQSGFDILLSRIGPYSIYDTSIQFLKSTLSDEIMDAYLHLLSSAVDSVYHVNSLVITAIFNGQEAVHSSLKNVDLYAYETVFGAYNEGGFHWTLIILHPKRKRILYMNPMGELFLSEQQLLQRWYNFLRKRFNMGIDNTPSGSWILHSPPHARQRDSISCGVYVLRLAECYLKGADTNFSMNQATLKNYRKLIGARILSQTDPIDDKCRKCYSMEDDKGDGSWIACEFCDLWFHCSCVSGHGGESFLCEMCSGTYRQVKTPVGERLRALKKGGKMDDVVKTPAGEQLQASKKGEKMDESQKPNDHSGVKSADQFFQSIGCQTDIQKEIIQCVIGLEDIAEFTQFKDTDTIEKTFDKYVLPNLKEMLWRPKASGNLSSSQRYWRHNLYVQNMHKCPVHTQVNTGSRSYAIRQKLLGYNVRHYLNLLCLSTLGKYKIVTKRRFGYMNAEYLSLREGGQDLLEILDDSISQNTNEAINYFTEVVFPEAEILYYSAISGKSYSASSRMLFPKPQKRKR